MYQEFLDIIIAISQLNTNQNFSMNPIIQLTKEIKENDPVGRVVIDLEDQETLGFIQLKKKIIYLFRKLLMLYMYMVRLQVKEQLFILKIKM